MAKKVLCCLLVLFVSLTSIFAKKTIDEKDVEIIKSDLFGTDFKYKNNEYSIAMSGEHQVKNMTCVIEACNTLKKYFKLTDENIKIGISKFFG